MVEQNATSGVCPAVIDLPQLKEKIKEKAKTDKKKDEGKQSDSYVAMFAAELIGTALLLFLGCMGCVTQFDDPKPSHHMSSLTFGLVITMIIQTFGHISGAHLNPAVTLATVLLGILKTKMALVYVVAQFLGAVLGFGLLKAFTPEEYTANGFCETTVHSKITVFQGLGIEIIITTLLIVICCAVWDQRNSKNTDSLPLRFGLIIAAISMAAGPLTGASMNTARSFAPIVFSGNWQDQWIYLVGPNVAVPIGCAIYKYLFAIPDDDDNDEANNEALHLDEITTQNGKC